jgi:hypothetical protein
LSVPSPPGYFSWLSFCSFFNEPSFCCNHSLYFLFLFSFSSFYILLVTPSFYLLIWCLAYSCFCKSFLPTITLLILDLPDFFFHVDAHRYTFLLELPLLYAKGYCKLCFFSLHSKKLLISPSTLFADALAIQQYIVRPPIVWILTVVSFAIAFYICNYFLIEYREHLNFPILMFKTCFMY